RPAKLLPLESLQLHRNFSRRFHIVEIKRLPAGQQAAIAQIQVFAQRVGLPPPHSRVFNARPPPDAAVAIERKRQPPCLASPLFHHKVTVQRKRLAARQRRIVPVQVSPARLDKANSLVASPKKMWHS